MFLSFCCNADIYRLTLLALSFSFLKDLPAHLLGKAYPLQLHMLSGFVPGISKSGNAEVSQEHHH